MKMSRLADRDWDPWAMDAKVTFDGPYGERMRGRIARIYFGDPAAFQVEVDGERYEAHIHADNMVPGWE